LGAGAIGALFTVAALGAAGVLDTGTSPAAPRSTTATPVVDAIASAWKRVSPAIVTVRVVGKKGSRTGSGVCIRHAGQVLTNYRLVAGARSVSVVAADGSVKNAKVVGQDPASDLALLAINGALDAADLAAPRSLEPGDPVYAVGSDSKGSPWLSSGIVSSLDGHVASGGTTMTGLIESNALIQPWVAGGALLDVHGRVVGILMTPVPGHLATVAVPVLLVTQITEGLRAYGRVDHGWLGLAGRANTEGQVVITALAARGPSERAGIKKGDVIVSVDSQTINTMDDLMAAARGHWPGDRIHVVVRRDDEDRTFLVRLSRMPRTPVITAASATTTTTVAATTTSKP
jgi:S1-C subfamily serine protease